MNTAQALIALPLAAAILIEVGDRLWINWRMRRNVAVAMKNLSPKTVCAQCGGQQIQQDNREQNILHRASPLPR